MNEQNFQQRIGSALVEAGVITEEQLAVAQEHHKRFSYFTLPQVVAILHKVPVSVIHEVNLHSVVLPGFKQGLLDRLNTLCRKDRFAHGLDVDAFVTSITHEVLRYEAQTIEAYTYVASENAAGDGSISRKDSRRYMVCLVDVRAVLTTVGGDLIRGLVHIAYDSRHPVVEVLDSDDVLKAGLYYALRNAHNQWSQV